MNNLEKDEFKDVCREKLKVVICKKELYFTRRCNKSIELAVSLALTKLDSLNEGFLLIQEEGGWLTYEKVAKKKKLTPVKLKMKEGRITDDRLYDEAFSNSILLIHSMPGYSYEENMKELERKADAKESEKKIASKVLINDCCGSIGTKNATFGNIIVCSFGKAKPLSVGAGGFIAADDFEKYNLDSKINAKELLESEEKEASDLINFEELDKQIQSLQNRLDYFHEKSKDIKYDLLKYGFKVLNYKNEGINVLVSFSDEAEKERLINYCKEKNIEYTECPRYIRTNKQALSLEIKRLKMTY